MSSEPLSNPLSAAQIRNLEQALYRLNQATLKVARAKAAGLDVEEEELRIAALRQQGQALLEQYRTS